MEVDISEPKSRAFNIFLRFLQLAASLLIAILIAQLDVTNCDTSFYKLVMVVTLILGAVSLIALLYLRCVTSFPKIEFYILLSAELIVSGIILVVSFAGFGQSNVCATNTVFFKFAVTLTILIVVMTLFILLSSFYWIQRYSNSPGNFTWAILFLSLAGTTSYRGQMVSIGLLSLTVTVLSIIANAVAAVKGINSCVKKTIVICWALSLVLMLTNEIIAIASFFKGGDTSDYNDMVSKKLLQIFMAVNIIEFLLWIFGLLTLKYQQGDKIRDTLLIFGQRQESDEVENDEPHNAGRGFGTLK